MDGDAHLILLREVASRGALVASNDAARALAADVWAWRQQRGEQQRAVFSDGSMFVTETAHDDRLTIRIAAPGIALTLHYVNGLAAEVWVAPAAAPSREFRFGDPPAAEVIDAPALAPTLDHVGGASPIEPARPRTAAPAHPSPQAPPEEPAEPAEPAARAPQSLDLTALHDVLHSLTATCRAMPEHRGIGDCHAALARGIEALCNAPPSAPGGEPDPDWIGVRSERRLVVASRDLYAVIATDATSANLASGAFVWQIDKDESGTRMRLNNGDVSRDWTVRSSGEVIDHAPPPWRATHVVGPEPAVVGGVPAVTFAAGTVLDPGLDVRVIDITANGWALVECSNKWQCYVAPHSLLAID